MDNPNYVYPTIDFSKLHKRGLGGGKVLKLGVNVLVHFTDQRVEQFSKKFKYLKLELMFQYIKTDKADEKFHFRKTLACTKDTFILQRLLDITLDNSHQVETLECKLISG